MTTTYEPLRHETDTGKIAGRLDEVAEAAVDIVATSDRMNYEHQNNKLWLPEAMPVHDGVYDRLPVRFTRGAFRQTCERLDVPLRYADLLAEEDADLLAHNFNVRAAFKQAPTDRKSVV